MATDEGTVRAGRVPYYNHMPLDYNWLTLGVHAPESYCSCPVCVCVWGGEKGEREGGERDSIECGRPLSASSKCMAVGYLHRLCMNTCPAYLSIV